MIPKASGVGQRPLGIPTIRDRVVQAAAVLVLEPIFEADFDEAAYGYRPKRSALDAVRKVSRAIDEGHTEVVDADLSKYFDTIPHSALMTSVARRISDGQMLRLIKLWLKAPVVETDEQGTSPGEWREEGHAGNTARRSGFAVTGEHLHASVHQSVSAARLGPSVRRGAGQLRGRLRHSLPPRGGRGAGDDPALDDPHRAHAERGQDAPAATPDATPSISSATPSARCTRRGPADAITVCGLRRRPSRPSRTPSVNGCGPGTRHRGRTSSRALTAPCGDGATYFSYGTVTKARHEVELHLYHAVRRFLRRRHKIAGSGYRRFPMPRRLWGTGCPVAADSRRARRCACRDVKPVREPDDRDGHVRFDERGGETE